MWRTAFAAGRGVMAFKSILMPIALIGLSGVGAMTVHAMTSGAAARAELAWVRESAELMQTLAEQERENSARVVELSKQARDELEQFQDGIADRKPEIPEEGGACPIGCVIQF